MLSFENLPKVMSNIFFLREDGVIYLSTCSIYKTVLFPTEGMKKTFNRVRGKLIMFFQLWIISESQEDLKFWFLPLVFVCIASKVNLYFQLI